LLLPGCTPTNISNLASFISECLPSTLVELDFSRTAIEDISQLEGFFSSSSSLKVLNLENIHISHVSALNHVVKPVVLLVVLPVIIDTPLDDEVDELGQDEIDYILENTS
jgi:Leucine-rich repeat (LRR) protein